MKSTVKMKSPTPIVKHFTKTIRSLKGRGGWEADSSPCRFRLQSNYGEMIAGHSVYTRLEGELLSLEAGSSQANGGGKRRNMLELEKAIYPPVPCWLES